MSVKVALEKRSRTGLPTGGKNPHVTVRMPQSLIDKVTLGAAANDAPLGCIHRLVAQAPGEEGMKTECPGNNINLGSPKKTRSCVGSLGQEDAGC